jgi:KaiC/GvpD/RAD55 family RecA-like ATPase
MARLAMLIATSTYQDNSLNDLRSPGVDVSDLNAVLADPAIGDYQVEQIEDSPYHLLTESTGRFLADRVPTDELLLYISGHAVRNDDLELHFAATNTRVDQLEDTTLPAASLARQLNRCRAGRVLILLDCCYAGAFTTGRIPKSAGPINLDQLKGGGRVIIAASTATEFAFAKYAEPNTSPQTSVFTEAVVMGLQSGDADRDNDGIVSPEDLFSYVSNALETVTPKQTPTLITDGMHGRWNVALSIKPRESSPLTIATDIATATKSKPPPEPARPLIDFLSSFMDEVEEINATPANLRSISTGLETFDELVGGYRPGQLVLISGPSGVGKSIFALQAARHAAITKGIGALLLSLELDVNAVVRRVLAAEGRVPVHFIADGTMSARDWDSFARVVPSFHSAPLFVKDELDTTIEALVETTAKDHELKLLVIDDLQLLAGTNSFPELVAVTRRLNLLAKQQGIVVLATVAADAENETPGSPIGPLDRYADLVVIIDRPDAYSDFNDRPGEADLYAITHRTHSRRATVAFQGHYARFTDMRAEVRQDFNGA